MNGEQAHERRNTYHVIYGSHEGSIVALQDNAHIAKQQDAIEAKHAFRPQIRPLLLNELRNLRGLINIAILRAVRRHLHDLFLRGLAC